MGEKWTKFRKYETGLFAWKGCGSYFGNDNVPSTIQYFRFIISLIHAFNRFFIHFGFLHAFSMRGNHFYEIMYESVELIRSKTFAVGALISQASSRTNSRSFINSEKKIIDSNHKLFCGPNFNLTIKFIIIYALFFSILSLSVCLSFHLFC